MSRSRPVIEGAKHIGGHTIKFTFTDGHQVQVDLKSWIQALPTPEERAYLRPALFKRFKVNQGHAIMWGDFDIVFPMVAIYHDDPDRIDPGIPMRPLRKLDHVRSKKIQLRKGPKAVVARASGRLTPSPRVRVS